MAVRAFYWHEQPVRRFRLRRRPTDLRIGNAGDLYNRDLIRHVYGEEPQNVPGEGRRILLVGSVVHRALPGDVIAGPGTKGIDPRPASEGALLWACRGPITLEALAAAGHDTSQVRFLADPGLIVDQVYPELADVEAERGRVIFIPHYRDRHRYRSTKRYRVVDIDAEPGDIAREIARAEHVLSASLHGVIFAQALGRPVTTIATDGDEPEIKYRDHFASIGQPWRTPPSLDEALRAGLTQEVVDLPAAVRSLEFPPRSLLEERGIVA